MRHLPILALFVAITASAQSWDKEPHDFRGVPFGANEETLRTTLGLKKSQCSNWMTGGHLFGGSLIGGHAIPEKRSCTSRDRFAGIEVSAQSFALHNDSFGNVQITFNSSQFDFIRSVLIERYGQPTEEKTLTFRNAYGAEVPSKVLRWAGTGAEAQLTQYTSTLNESFFDLSSRAWLDQMQRERNEAAKKAATSF